MTEAVKLQLPQPNQRDHGLRVHRFVLFWLLF